MEESFVRFKGNNQNSIDQERLRKWVEVLNGSQNGLSKVFFFHHHEQEEYCVDTIEFMSKLIGRSQNEIPSIKHNKSDQLSLL